MNLKYSFLLKYALVSLALGACGSGGSNSSSEVKFKLPETFSHNSKASVSSLNTSGAVTCFAVNIIGDGIDATAKKGCEPSYGEFVGMIKGGEEITLNVQRGDSRTLELFYFAGSNGSCPTISKTNGLGQFGTNRVHRLARVEGIEMNSAQVDVQLPIQFPIYGNTLDVIGGYSSSCKAQVANGESSKLIRNVSGSAQSTFGGGRYKASIRVGPTPSLSKNKNIIMYPHELGVSQ